MLIWEEKWQNNHQRHKQNVENVTPLTLWEKEQEFLMVEVISLGHFYWDFYKLQQVHYKKSKLHSNARIVVNPMKFKPLFSLFPLNNHKTL